MQFRGLTVKFKSYSFQFQCSIIQWHFWDGIDLKLNNRPKNCLSNSNNGPHFDSKLYQNKHIIALCALVKCIVTIFLTSLFVISITSTEIPIPVILKFRLWPEFWISKTISNTISDKKYHIWITTHTKSTCMIPSSYLPGIFSMRLKSEASVKI